MIDCDTRLLRDVVGASDLSFCEAIRTSIVSRETLVPDIPSFLNQYPATTFPGDLWGFSVTLSQPLLEDLSVIRIGERAVVDNIRKALSVLRTHVRRSLFKINDSRLCAVSLDFISPTPARVNLAELLNGQLTVTQNDNLGFRLVSGDLRQYLLPLRRLSLEVASADSLKEFLTECFLNCDINAVEAYTFATRSCVFSTGRWQELVGLNTFPYNGAYDSALHLEAIRSCHPCCRGDNSSEAASKFLPRVPTGTLLAALETTQPPTVSPSLSWDDVKRILKSQRHDGGLIPKESSGSNTSEVDYAIATQSAALKQLISYCGHEDDLSIVPQITAGMDFLSRLIRERLTMRTLPRDCRESLFQLVNSYELLTADRGYSRILDTSEIRQALGPECLEPNACDTPIFADSKRPTSDLTPIFEKKYKQNSWGCAESVSGPGSTLSQTQRVVFELPKLLAQLRVRRVLDIPCGDWNWMKAVDLTGIDYLGADIVRELVEQNQKFSRPGVRFATMDLLTDNLPNVDLMFSRDCLVHFSFQDITTALTNIIRSDSRLLLMTHFPGQEENRDIPTGRWRPLNWETGPFHFPPPDQLLFEFCSVANRRFADKCLALWKLSSLITPVSALSRQFTG